MLRRSFLAMLGGVSLLSAFGIKFKGRAMKQPALFLGHGSPMNAVKVNAFTQKLQALGNELLRPKAILIISAHWETNGSWLTGMEEPKTIHDFYGFPEELFQVQYPAKGDPGLVESLQRSISTPTIKADLNDWGLDHGTWSVLRHMYPNADIPVVQLSIDRTKSFEYHYELGKKLSFLREQGVLVMGSGNIVHNLSKISWDEKAAPFDWALEFDAWVKEKIIKRDFSALHKEVQASKEAKLSIPTPEHYIPLLYVLGAGGDSESINFDIEEIQNASISMRSVRIG